MAASPRPFPPQGRGRRSYRVMLTTDAVGGVWRQTLELAAGLTAGGTQVLLAILGPRPNAAQRAEAASLNGCDTTITDLPLDWTADSAEDLRRAGCTLASIAVDWDADTIQLHAPALVADVDLPAPVVTMAHSCVGTWWRAVRGGDLPPELAWRAECTRRGLLAADAVLAPSRSFAAELAAFYGLQRPVQVVTNGARSMQVQRSKRSHALTAGRLWDEGKNIGMLDAAAGLSSVPVRAAGPISGPNGAAVAPRNLRLLGTLGAAGLACEYARAAVFVSVARYEPFGLAVLEAAQAGCALLLSDIPSFRELWDGAALFVDASDPIRIADALRALVAEPTRCDQLGTVAREQSRRYRPEAMIAGTWAVHRELLADRAMAAA